jgi:hypothetical protein
MTLKESVRSLSERCLRRIPFARSAYYRLDILQAEMDALKRATAEAPPPPPSPPPAMVVANSMLDDERHLVPMPSVIVDVGAHHGTSTIEYLDAYPNAWVFAFEANEDNHREAVANLRPYGERVRLSRLALAEHAGIVSLHVNSHHGTHSLLPLGDIETG